MRQCFVSRRCQPQPLDNATSVEVTMKLASLCLLLAASLIILGPQNAHGEDPSAATGNSPKPPTGFGQTCTVYGYRCPTELSCQFQAMPPAPDSGILQYAAYVCRHPQLADPKATSCPIGLVAQWVTPSPDGGKVGVATLRCLPDPRACPAFSAAWVKQTAWPLDPPALGYTCRYVRASR
jgi:hypothetical protein